MDEADHGLRLTDAEYERQIVELHCGLPPMPTRSEDREIRRRELDLAIDHRLGLNFPSDRREAMWAVAEQVERRRLRLGFRYVLRKVLARRLARDAQTLAEDMADAYANVLSPAELERFLGLSAGQRPAQPIDLDQLRKE